LNAAATTNLTPIVITDDIDGNVRNATTPDIGADEFSIEDVGVGAVLLNTAGYCPATSFNLGVRIRNYSLYAFSGAIPVFYQIAGSAPVNAVTPVVNIAVGDSILYTFTNTQSIAVSGTYTVHAGTALAMDINHQNDTTNRPLVILNLPAANAGSDQTICLGDSVTLTASGGVGYQWSISPPNNTASVTVMPLLPQTYTVTVVSAEGCIDSAQVTITPVNLPTPVASFTYVSAGLQISFTSTSTDATAYDWTFGDGGTSTSQNPVYNYPGSGNYTTRLIAANLCASDTTEQLLGVVGMAENMAEAGMSLGPNPAVDVIHIYYAPLGCYEIVSIQGQLMQSGSLTTRNFDVSRLEAGVYFIRISDEKGQVFVGKFLKE
jgi:PKD repeat protein